MSRWSGNLIGVVGVFACLAVGAVHLASVIMAGPQVLSFVQTPLGFFCGYLFNNAFKGLSNPEDWALTLYVILYVVWGTVLAVAFWWHARGNARQHHLSATYLLVMQLLIALSCEPSLLYVIAAEMAFVLPLRKALLGLCWLIAAYSALRMPYLLGLGGLMAPLDIIQDGLDVLTNVAWMMVAFGVGCVAGAERNSRMKLEAAHAELQATQHLLKDTLRVSERARISRNLHDVLGHHLTSLNLHLQLGLRQSGEQAIESFRLSSQLAQGLLGEIRQVVSTEREERSINLLHALELLCSGIPQLQVDLSYPAEIQIKNPALAHALFQCVQEAITNAMKHAEAKLVRIFLTQEEQSLNVIIQDDGKGAAKVVEGSGLQGMRERVEQLQGQFKIVQPTVGGFALCIQFPLAKAQA